MRHSEQNRFTIRLTPFFRTVIALFESHVPIFDKADYSGKVGILIGNEANGLSDEASELANEKVLIPMAGSVESLNAAVAAALLMYEAFRNQKLS